MKSTTLCACGCGQFTNIARQDKPRWGHVKGEPLRFLLGHIRKLPRIPLADRFWPKVNKTETCWLWTASVTSHGYGQIYSDGRPRIASIVSWEMHFGSIPDGLEVCHNCPGGDNPLCVNPAHLWLGTHKENHADRVKKRATHCRRGHLMDDANTYFRPSNGRRICKACRRKWGQAT